MTDHPLERRSLTDRVAQGIRWLWAPIVLDGRPDISA